MRLIGDFYKVVGTEKDSGKTVCKVEMNGGHMIYRSHFPGNPVTPGACLVQMSVEMLQLLSRKRLQLAGAKRIKFRQMVRPTDSPSFVFEAAETDGDTLTATVTVESEGQNFAKMSLRCRITGAYFDCPEGLCAVIPTYNNASTIIEMIKGVSRYCPDVIVVSDGCSDNTDELIVKSGCRVTLVSYPRNRGKGYAIVRGLRKAKEMGFSHALTIDADGQHFADDIPLLAASMRADRKAIILGCRNLNEENMPRRNTFANKFSNFWFRLQTGESLPDTQSGFRIYPLDSLCCLRLVTSRYEGELALLVFSAWKGVGIVPVAVRVYYPERGKGVSHFRPASDFARISVLNTVLCLLALVYGWPRRILRRRKRN